LNCCFIIRFGNLRSLLHEPLTKFRSGSLSF
jgi:hypothetical protein